MISCIHTIQLASAGCIAYVRFERNKSLRSRTVQMKEYRSKCVLSFLSLPLVSKTIFIFVLIDEKSNIILFHM